MNCIQKFKNMGIVGQSITGVVIAVLLMLLLLFFPWYTVTVQPNEELVVVDRPYIFGHEGIRDQPLTEGRYYLWKSSRTIEVNKAPILEEVSFDDISSSDNILLDFSSTIQMQITDSTKIVRYGAHWFGVNIKSQYANIVRNAVKQKKMSDIMSSAETSTQLDNLITSELEKLLREEKLPVKLLNVSLGRAKPNANVQEEIDRTAAQQQRKNSMDAMKLSEDARADAERARANADNAYRDAMKMDSNQFIFLEGLKTQIKVAEMYSDACKKAANCIVSPSGVTPTKEVK